MKQMMRTYSTLDGKTIKTDKAKFFMNKEVEKTPMYGKQTLLVPPPFILLFGIS